MRRLIAASATVLVLSGTAYALSGPCGWLDRAFARSGCLARFHVPDLVVTGDPVTVNAAGQLVAGGLQYRETGRSRRPLSAEIVVVDLDEANGVARRIGTGRNGWPVQLRLSPDGSRIAISCNALWVCDLPGGSEPDSSSFMLFDRDGGLLWHHTVPPDQTLPDSEGRAFDLAWSESGAVLFADSGYDPATGSTISTREEPAQGLTGTLPHAAKTIPGSAVALPALPDGFIPFLTRQLAWSPDRTRAAVLSRRFSGPGNPVSGDLRARIEVFDMASGKLLARHDVAEDLAPVILWHPTDDGILVALAGETRAGAGTDFRIYRSEGRAE